MCRTGPMVHAMHARQGYVAIWGTRAKISRNGDQQLAENHGVSPMGPYARPQSKDDIQSMNKLHSGVDADAILQSECSADHLANGC